MSFCRSHLSPAPRFAVWLLALGMPAAGLSQKLSSSALRDAAAYSRGTGQVALIVWQDGSNRLRESSDRLRQQDGVHDVRSVTKSLWALAALKAVEEGHASLDAPVSRWLPEWSGDARGTLTLRQMLSMTSGLEPAASSIYRQGFRDLNRIALATPRTLEPGSAFRYGPSGYECGWETLRRAVSPTGLPLELWYTRQVAEPAGAQAPWLKRDDTGRPFASAGAKLRPDDLLHLGTMLARDGKAGPLRRVLTEESVDTAFRGTTANPAYGLGFWLNAQAAAPGAAEAFPEDLVDRKPAEVDWTAICLSRAAPADLAVMLGSSGQRVYISRVRRLVVVRLGEGKDFRDAAFLGRLFGG